MREVLLHGIADEAFDHYVLFARRIAESFGARLHVVYTIEDPLSAGWTSEVGAEHLPDVHQAMEAEARDRLSTMISHEDQDRLGVQIVLRTGPAAKELVRYTEEHQVDLAIVHAPTSDNAVARALLDHGRCAVLVLR
jgi:nucleotide-binding universal stress UspA family protein